MSHWNYRIVKVAVDEINDEFGVYEVYYDDDGKPNARTMEPAGITGDTKEEIISSLIRALASCLDSEVLDDSEIGGELDGD